MPDELMGDTRIMPLLRARRKLCNAVVITAKTNGSGSAALDKAQEGEVGAEVPIKGCFRQPNWRLREKPKDAFPVSQ